MRLDDRVHLDDNIVLNHQPPLVGSSENRALVEDAVVADGYGAEGGVEAAPRVENGMVADADGVSPGKLCGVGDEDSRREGSRRLYCCGLRETGFRSHGRWWAVGGGRWAVVGGGGVVAVAVVTNFVLTAA